ncbi:ATP-binding protein [Vibrio sp.]|nr:ATP-binding protein [Vibrio sp.]
MIPYAFENEVAHYGYDDQLSSSHDSRDGFDHIDHELMFDASNTNERITDEYNKLTYSEQQEQIESYKAIIDAMPAGVILLDTQGVIREVNREALRILECDLKNHRWVAVIESAFDPREDDGHEISLKNGKKVKLAISASDCGQLILITDLTETRRLQARVSDLQRLSSLGKMVASLAHQVRTPLSSAMLYASNLSISNLPSATHQRFQSKLMDRLHDLEKQINDMLMFAKGGDNKVIKPFYVADLEEELLPMVETLIKAHEVDFDLTFDSPQHQCMGNVNTIASAICNLIINAIQATGNGAQIKVHISADQRHVGTENEQLLITVCDNGPGISTDLQSKILEPFFTTKTQGTGLGLAVVNMICCAHDGQLTLKSTPGEGACFTITLPLMNKRGTA